MLGVVWNFGTNLTIDNTTFSDNKANNAGVITNSGQDAKIINNTISNNSINTLINI